MAMVRSVVGYLLFLLIALWLRDEADMKLDKSWRPVVYGVLFQIVVGFAITNMPVFVTGIEYVARGVMKLRDATLEGTKFVFGYVGGGDLPFDLKEGGSPFVFAFQALPTVIIVGTLSAALTYLRVLPYLAKVVGYIFKVVFKIKDSIGMVSAAKIFVGQLEAPLLIKQKLATLSKSDIFIILALAFSTSSAAVMPIYASTIEAICPTAMKHIVTASVMTVISTLIVCTLIMPSKSTEMDVYSEDAKRAEENGKDDSFMGAITKGISDGFFVWWCIVGSLIGMIALLAFVNYLLDVLPNFAGAPITLQRLFGMVMYPFAWLVGIEDRDLVAAAQILGTKIAANEMVAFFELAKSHMSSESVMKTIYAINNFGNFSCIGITVGGLLALAPGQKCIPSIVGKAFMAGILATGLTTSLMDILFSL
jgi:CNT family concentrative nucleoside transporter